MRLIKDTGIKESTSGNKYRYAIFECLSCKEHIEKIKADGLKSNYCSHKCYAQNRKMRGSYKIDKKIMSRKYVYIYCPEHPNAIGTRKLYVAEHRLVMEKHIGRYLTKDEVVHHIDENTTNNDISNLQLMTPSDHSKHHISKRHPKKK